jgi:hypothetical protein
MQERHPGKRPTLITPQLQAKVLAATRRKPSDGSTHWSCRKLAKQLDISKDVVHRIWRTAGLRPHRLERYMASNDPDFERKAADVIGLYLNPPQHAAIFCLDEKSAIQALDRRDPVLPMSPGRAERHGFEYYRHGTLSLYAALDLKTGKVHGKTVPGTPATNSLPSSSRSSANASVGRRSISFWIIRPHTRQRRRKSFCRNIQM